MSQLTSVRPLTSTTFILPKASDVMLALGTTFDVSHYDEYECLKIMNKDFILFVNTFMPQFVTKYDFKELVSSIHQYQLKRLEFRTHHQLRSQLADVVYGPLVYTCGCEHVSLALDCIEFDADSAFEKDAFDTAVQDGEIADILTGLKGMVDHVTAVHRNFMTTLDKRDWIFEDDAIIQGIHTINRNDISKIADSIELEFETHFSSTMQYVNETNMKRYFPVDLPQLPAMLATDVKALVDKGLHIEYADFCDFIAKHNLHFEYSN